MASDVENAGKIRFDRADCLALGGLTLVYVVLHGAIALSISAFEPAVHNDDWVYTLVVKRICEQGQFQLHRLSGALALPQILAGAVWCKAAGEFSFTALRTMMVLHGILPVWLLWLFLRQLNLARAPATLAVLLFCVNPITVSLTWSFQTDLVYLSFVLAALIMTLWADREPKPLDSAFRLVLAAAVLLLLAFLTRQMRHLRCRRCRGLLGSPPSVALGRLHPGRRAGDAGAGKMARFGRVN